MVGSNEARIISDRYLLTDRVGSGGMGTVWRATDQLLRRRVAVKEVHPDTTVKSLASQAARGRREAHAIARISHPNVVNIYDLVVQDDRLWLVMELVDGPSLKEHITDNGPLGFPEVAEIGRQLLAALDSVHAAGVLHRDIKPGNILLRSGGTAVLCDFGIVALAETESITTSGAMVGSARYVAPERLTGQPAGPPSDLFSLGVTLCELLSGRSPFARADVAATLHAIAHEEAEIPAAAGPLRPLLEALLRKDPAHRPSVADATATLRSLSTAPRAADNPPTGRARPAGAPRRRRLAGLSVRSAVLALVAAVAGALVVRLVSSPDPEGTPEPEKSEASHAAPQVPEGPTPTDAVMPVPGHPNVTNADEYWMFSADLFMRGDISSSGYPVLRRGTETSSLEEWDGTFAELPGFRDRIDATFRVPGSKNEYWVFSDDQYIRIRINSHPDSIDDTLVKGPSPITDWGNEFGEFAENGIDAVMRTPDDPRQYWFFSGARYVRVLLDGEGPSGEVNYGPAALARWSTLKDFAASGQGVDSVLPVPGERNDYWVFSHDQYKRIRVSDSEYQDTAVHGPEPLRNWDSLPQN